MFQFASFTTAAYGFSDGRRSITSYRFPDSEIPGSLPA